MEPRRRELRADAGEFEGVAEEGAAERFSLRRVVIAAVVVGLEEDRRPTLAADVQLRRVHSPAFDASADVALLLVDDAERISGLQVGEVDLPPEDVDERRDHRIGHAAAHGGGVEARFDHAADGAHLHHARQALDLRGDVAAVLAHHQRRLRRDLVLQPGETVGAAR